MKCAQEHAITILISFCMSSLRNERPCLPIYPIHSWWKLRTEKVRFVLSVPPYWLSENYHFHPCEGKTSWPRCPGKVLSSLSSSSLQLPFLFASFSFFVFSPLLVSFYNPPSQNFMEPALCITLSYSWLFLHSLVYTNWLLFYFQDIYY